MPQYVILPDRAGTGPHVLARWLKGDGDAVQVGEAIAEVETDKAAFEIEVDIGGTLIRRLVEPGDEIASGQAIAVVGAPDDDREPGRPPAPGTAASPASALPAPVASGSAKAPGARSDAAQGGPGGKVAGLPLRQAASPLARRLASETGIVLAHVKGSGPGGRILKADVLEWAAQAPKAPPLGSSALAPPRPTGREVAPSPGHDTAVADDFFTLAATLALRPALLFLDAVNTAARRPVDLLALVARAAAMAMSDGPHPANAVVAIDVHILRGGAMRRIDLISPQQRSISDLSAALLAADGKRDETPCALRVIDLTELPVSDILLTATDARIPTLMLGGLKSPASTAGGGADAEPVLRLGLTVPPESWPLPVAAGWLAAVQALLGEPLRIVA